MAGFPVEPPVRSHDSFQTEESDLFASGAATNHPLFLCAPTPALWSGASGLIQCIAVVELWPELGSEAASDRKSTSGEEPMAYPRLDDVLEAGAGGLTEGLEETLQGLPEFFRSLPADPSHPNVRVVCVGLTDGAAGRYFAFTMLLDRFAYALVSVFPVYRFAQRLLGLVVAAAQTPVAPERQACRVAHMLHHLVSRLPPPSFGVELRVKAPVVPDAPAAILRWGPNPLLPADEAFAEVLQLLEPRDLLALWQCLLMEKKVVVVSEEVSVLQPACEFLVALLQPLLYCHTVIPLLPPNLAGFLDAPVALIAGATPSTLSVSGADMSDLCVAYLPTRHIHLPDDVPYRIPAALEAQLLPHLARAYQTFPSASLSTLSCPLQPCSRATDVLAVFHAANLQLLCARHCRVRAFHRDTTPTRRRSSSTGFDKNLVVNPGGETLVAGSLHLHRAEAKDAGSGGSEFDMVWVELDPLILTIFRDADDVCDAWIRTADLRAVAPSPLEPEGMVFEVTVPSRAQTLRFMAQSEDRRETWIAALEAVIRGTSGSPASDRGAGPPTPTMGVEDDQGSNRSSPVGNAALPRSRRQSSPSASLREDTENAQRASTPADSQVLFRSISESFGNGTMRSTASASTALPLLSPSPGTSLRSGATRGSSGLRTSPRYRPADNVGLLSVCGLRMRLFESQAFTLLREKVHRERDGAPAQAAPALLPPALAPADLDMLVSRYASGYRSKAASDARCPPTPASPPRPPNYHGVRTSPSWFAQLWGRGSRSSSDGERFDEPRELLSAAQLSSPPKPIALTPGRIAPSPVSPARLPQCADTPPPSDSPTPMRLAPSPPRLPTPPFSPLTPQPWSRRTPSSRRLRAPPSPTPHVERTIATLPMAEQLRRAVAEALVVQRRTQCAADAALLKRRLGMARDAQAEGFSDGFAVVLEMDLGPTLAEDMDEREGGITEMPPSPALSSQLLRHIRTAVRSTPSSSPTASSPPMSPPASPMPLGEVLHSALAYTPPPSWGGVDALIARVSEAIRDLPPSHLRATYLGLRSHLLERLGDFAAALEDEEARGAPDRDRIQRLLQKLAPIDRATPSDTEALLRRAMRIGPQVGLEGMRLVVDLETAWLRQEAARSIVVPIAHGEGCISPINSPPLVPLATATESSSRVRGKHVETAVPYAIPDAPPPPGLLNGQALWTGGRKAARQPNLAVFDFLDRMRELWRFAAPGALSPGSSVVITEALLRRVKESSAYCLLALETSELQAMDMHNLAEADKLAFYLNLHNLLAMHACVELGGPGPSLWRRFEWMSRAQYSVGGHFLSLVEIEHCILRAHSSAPSGMFFSAFLLPRFPEGDSRRRLCLNEPHPLLTFGLSSLTRSAAPLRLFRDAATVEEELRFAVAAYLDAGTKVAGKTVFLPELIKFFWTDFVPTHMSRREGLLEVAALMSPELRKRVTEAFYKPESLQAYEAWQPSRRGGKEKPPPLRQRRGAALRFAPYDWSPMLTVA